MCVTAVDGFDRHRDRQAAEEGEHLRIDVRSFPPDSVFVDFPPRSPSQDDRTATDHFRQIFRNFIFVVFSIVVVTSPEGMSNVMIKKSNSLARYGR
jgi:hypothetical protein